MYSVIHHWFYYTRSFIRTNYTQRLFSPTNYTKPQHGLLG